MANELRHSDVGTALSKSEWEATGGHIFNSQAAGDIMYASTTSQLTRLGIGTANQVLATNSGATAPEWVTGVASATVASTVVVVDSTDTSSYIAMFDSATGSLAAKTDAGITYNAGTGMLTATGFTGPLTGTLQTASQTNITAVGTIATGVWQGTAIASGYIAADAVTGAKIADDAIDSEHYTDGSIDNAHLADNSVDSDNYVDGSIDNIHLADNSVDSDNYVDGSIDNAHIADDAIDSEHYAAASIDFAHIQNVAANSILGRNANSSGVLSEVALATTQILIGDGTGFTAAALSGDVTMANDGAVTLGTVAVGKGGTGATSLAADGVLIGNDTSAVTVVDMGTKGDILIGDGTGNPSVLDIGSNDEVLVADSGETTGVKWAALSAAAVTQLNNATENELVTVAATTTQLDAEANLTFASDVLTIASSSASLPRIDITNTHADATAGEIRFNKNTVSGDDDDIMGKISWYGTDAGEATHEELAYIDAIITDSAAGSEAASLRFYVAENDATRTLGLQLAGQADDDGEIDVTIGAGAASNTTIAGILTMGSTAAMTNAGLVSVADQSNITGLGTITSGTWTSSTAVIASAYLDADTAHLSTTQTFTGAKTFTNTITVGVDDDGKDVKFFGESAGAYMEWDESEDQLRIMGASADATTSTGKLLLATSLTDINANDVIGKIEFQAPHETGGTDAITIASAIEAVAQGTFSASVNSTDLVFKTGHSEAATEKFRFTSQGEIGIGGANYGTDGQVLTSGGAGVAPAWEDAGGGGTITIDDTDGTLAVGEAVAMLGDHAVGISGYAEIYHDLTYPSDVSGSSSHFRNMQIIPIADGTNRVMRIYSYSGWSHYLVIQVGTWVSATREMTWGVPVRTDNQMAAMHAVYDSAEDVVAIAYQDDEDSGRMCVLIVQPHASANSIITVTSGNDIAPVRTEIGARDGNGDLGATGLEIDRAEHYGIWIAEDAVNDKLIIAYPEAEDSGECKLVALTIVPDDDGTTGDRHKVTSYIGETNVSTNGDFTTGIQMGFRNGKGLVVYNAYLDSEYTHAQGFTVDTSGPSFTLTGQQSDGTSEPFGADKKVMMHADIAVTRDTPTITQLSYDNDNDVWLVTGTYLDGDSDAVPALATVTVGTRGTAGPGGGNTLALMDNFNIASAEDPLQNPPAGSGHFLIVDTLIATSATELSDDFVMGSVDFAPAIAYDEDRNCHVMVFVSAGLRYESEMHRYNDSTFLWFGTVTTLATGGSITVRHTGEYAPYMPRDGSGNQRIRWGHYDNHATDGYSWSKLAYDTSNNIMFHTIAYDWARENYSSESGMMGLHVGAFHGRTTAAGGGAADDATRDLVYGTSNMKEFIGFNTTAVSTNDDPATVTVAGGLNENQGSQGTIAAGKQWFIGDDGILRAKLPGMTENLFRAGVSTASNKLLVSGAPFGNFTS